MSRLVSLLSKEPLTLIVKLPENTVEMAKAAEASGAGAICLNYSEDKDALRDIIDAVKIPMGMSLDENILTEAEMKDFKKLGFDFIDIPSNDAPDHLLKIGGFGRILSLDPDYSEIDLTKLSDRPIDGLDAAVIMPEDWGKDLNVGDLQQYITIAMSTTLPVIVPAQKSIRASEVPIIWDTGTKGIMIGESITGDTVASLKAVIKEYRSAIGSIKQ
jgi:hypothetical protein